MRFSIVEDSTGFTGVVVSTVEGFMVGDSMVVGSMEGATEGTDNGQGLTVRVRLGRW
jgi:hypothetical protein